MNDQQRFSSSAGIAIGPILFVIALLAVLAMVMASGNGDYQVANSADRITADIVTQANMIRNTISQCNLQYMLEASTTTISNASFVPTTDPYPVTPASGLVADLVCSPTTGLSLWNDKTLPPPTSGFGPWNYIDAGNSNGRCIWTSPTSSNPASNGGITSGLVRAAAKFNTSTTYTSAAEALYDPSGVNNPNQKFIVWITLPTSGTPDSHCVFP
jgi:hypothetical protein